LIGAGNGVDNLGMDSSVIIAGEASKRLVMDLWHIA
jgi:hypothetical protein